MQRIALAVLLLFSSSLTSVSLAATLLGLDAAVSPTMAKSHPFSGDGEYDSFLLVRARPHYEIYSDSYRFEAGYELNGLFYSEMADRQGSATITPLRLCDIKREAGSGGDFLLTQNFDRLNLLYDFVTFSLTVGRQPIGHGSGRFFNPTDIFAPLTPYSTYTEYKAGVDALRVTAPFGEDASLEFIGVAHEEGHEDSYYLARVEKVFSSFNFSAYGGSTLGAGTLALDIAGDIGDAGWYLEAITRDSKALSESTRAMAGLHHRFASKVNFIVEVFYNGPGAGDKEDYFKATLSREYLAGESTFLGEKYILVETDYQLSPLMVVGMSWLGNLGDTSGLLQPIFEWPALESGGATVTVRGGASLRIKGKGSGSEFSTYPDIIFVEAQLNL